MPNSLETIVCLKSSAAHICLILLTSVSVKVNSVDLGLHLWPSGSDWSFIFSLYCTVLSAKIGSDVFFCLQSYQELRIVRSFGY